MAGGKIVLLHDAGGDRSQTLVAYNEDRVITKTLNSVLHTSYPGEISIWVVDRVRVKGNKNIQRVFR